ncbi:MFS general substrate transporter [Gloeophyllum trabeum ATCC 11539]|uniref:MFS general substrate transporter n=1 Tax=Gloeophyllum trabeum (strain ATCC 11539 / FP-39264 / Madison 617) TaxID=670483 RepID=S7QB51_GLOTA|nr:MFS general substrate transporter [Gloeophyllum trabeum ATCC 11539]EPQ57161.1 MFS general substrate transporter [Gloeophyllum trabeum ATCC 11539]
MSESGDNTGGDTDILSRKADERPSPEDGKDSNDKVDVTAQVASLRTSETGEPQEYRLYKQRFVGLAAIFLLNVISGMNWPWFGPIANNTARDYNISLDQVNWLGNTFSIIYLPTAVSIPPLIARFGLRTTCIIGAICLILASWIRYSSTAHSLSPNSAYALLIIGQIFAAFAQPVFQVIGPKYSETWFDLRGRTTATMIIAIANPIGGALGQLISPIAGDTRQSILVLGIISTIVTPAVLVVGSAPPTPPTYIASQHSPSLKSLLRAMAGKQDRSTPAYMTIRERMDFAIMILIFGVLVSATNTFSILSDQYMSPVGYSSDISGLMGATLLLSGIVAAIVTAPLFDRVLTHHLGPTVRILCPILAAAWLSLIWAVKPHNTGGLFAIMAILGTTSITMLPVALELGCELTRNADGSSALLWASGNMFSIIFILVEGALRAGPDANPPLNMRRALIFNAAFVWGAVVFVVLFRGKQARRAMDEHRRNIHDSPRQEDA